MMTHNDVKKDIQIIMDKIAEGQLELASRKQAIFISSVYTLPCTLLHAALAMYLYMFIAPSIEILWMFLGITFASFFISLIQYPNSLFYLSIPSSVRQSSTVLHCVRKSYLKSVKLMIFINAIAVGAVIVNEEYLLAVPVCFAIGFFATQFVLGTETARYGIGSLIEKASNLMQKI